MVLNVPFVPPRAFLRAGPTVIDPLRKYSDRDLKVLRNVCTGGRPA